MSPVKEKKIIQFKKTENKEKSTPARKLFILSLVVLIAVIVSQWGEIMSLFPKLDNKVYRIAQTEMGEHTIHSFDNKKMAYIGKNGLMVVDGKGKEKFSYTAIMDSPAMDVSDSKIIFAPKGKKTIYSVTGSGKITEFKTADEVVNLKITDKGRIVAITNKKTYNGSAVVYSSRGDALFSWDAGTCNLLDASLSPDGKKLAISVIYTGGKKLECSVMLFEIEKSGTPYSEKSTGDNFISAIEWLDNNTLMVVGDKKMYALNSKGADKWEFDYEGKILSAFSIEQKNNIVVALGHSSLDKEYMVYSFTSGGRKQGEYLFNDNIENISTNESRILITSSSKAQVINKRGKLHDEITTDKHIYGGYLYNKGYKVMFDMGGYIEIMEMR